MCLEGHVDGGEVDTCETARNVLAMPAEPRRFALVLDPHDPDYQEYVDVCRPTSPLLWWGAAFSSRALLYRLNLDGTPQYGCFSSPAHALAVWHRSHPVRLDWLQPPTGAESATHVL